MTLLAYTLCSTDAPSFGSIRLNEVEDICIAQVRCVLHPRFDLTKRTIEGMLNGYPPWYREYLEVAHGPIVPHPIKSRDDIYRAGWVVAVGLSDVAPQPYTITECDFMGQPIRRILYKMRDEIQPHYPQDPTLKAAIAAMEYMITMHTGSGLERYLTAGLRTDFGTDVTAALSGSDCTFAMEVFNDVGPLSDPDKARLTPILQPVIDAAFRGSYIVVQEFKNGVNGGNGFRIPPRLENYSQPVYLDLGRTR
ncbi:MAG: hypothetical protein Q9213_000870 [Squamulea squamosa]